MTDKAVEASAAPSDGFLDLKDLMANAIDDHGKATAEVLRRWGQGDKIDVLAEATACVGRLVKTSAQFIVFWDNIATLLAANRDQPRNYPPPPVGAPGLVAMTTVDSDGATAAVVGSGLRRRGEDKESVPASRITVTHGSEGFVVTVDCEGVARGLYEGTLDANNGTGAKQQIVYNIYVNPV